MGKLISLFDDFSIRDKIIYKNIFYSFSLKGVNILISLFQVRISLDLLTSSQYGVWLTIMSILSWVSILDIGFGNGLRNKLTEVLSKKNFLKARNYITTAYFMLGSIFFSAIIIIVPLLNFINWQKILKISHGESDQISVAIIIAFCGLCILFVLKLLNVIFLAHQKSAVPDMLAVVSQLSVFIVLLLMREYSKGTILVFSMVYSILPITIYMIANLYCFTTKFKSIAPSFVYFEKKNIRDILELGGKFFIIQFSAIILYSTDNFIINYFFGGSNVTIFSIPLRYFTLITMSFQIILLPYWSMTTLAYNQGDFNWVQKAVKKLITIWLGFLLMSAIMLVLSDFVFSIWIGDKIKVPFLLTFTLMINALVMNWAAIFNTIMFGMGKINYQVWLSIFSILFNIPLILILINFTTLSLFAVPIVNIIYSLIVGTLVPLKLKKELYLLPKVKLT